MGTIAIILASSALIGSVVVLITAAVFYHRGCQKRAAAAELTAEHDELLFRRLAAELSHRLNPYDEPAGRHARSTPVELIDTSELDDLAGIRPIDGPRCPDCDVAPGEPHEDGCDTARCTVTGRQRLTCPPLNMEPPYAGYHDCGRAVWEGRWPAADVIRALVGPDGVTQEGEWP